MTPVEIVESYLSGWLSAPRETRSIGPSERQEASAEILQSITGGGWRIVRTDLADQPIVITDEWQPDTTPLPDVVTHVVTPIEEG
jgi:hypothetical protein